jgi:hypothetical protein
MFDFLKSKLPADGIDEEQFREPFEAQKKSAGHVYSLTKTDGVYNDPAIQNEWAEYVEFEKLKITAW